MKQMFDDYYKCFGCGNDGVKSKPAEDESASYGARRGRTANTPNTKRGEANSENMTCNECVVNRIGYAQAYVPYQTDTEMYGTEMGLESGTVFTALNMPYKRGTNLELFGREASV